MADYKNQIVVNLNRDKEFRDIFNNYYIVLCIFADKFVENEAVSADIVQECFIKLWQIRTDFNYLHQVKSFLYTSVRNKALNELEHSKVVDDYANKYKERSKESFFRDHVIEEETYRLLNEAIDRLPPQTASIMRLALEGMKNPQIAETLQISEETVRTLKKSAYKKLRRYLGDYYYLLFFFLI